MGRVRSHARLLLARLLRFTGAFWLARRFLRSRAIVVLTFHRVLPDQEFASSSSLPSIVVRERTFGKFLSWAARRFELVDLRCDSPWAKPAGRLPRIAITFDDGWLDNYQVAGPLLAGCDAPATIFLCPRLMDTPFPFWPERVRRTVRSAHNLATLRARYPQVSAPDRESFSAALIESLKPLEPSRQRLELEQMMLGTLDHGSEPLNRTMTWDQVRMLQSRSIGFGSHTSTHVLLTSVSTEVVTQEVTGSKQEMESALAAPCRLFAYPNGNHDGVAREQVRLAGYEAAFTTGPGYWTKSTDPFAIPRINVAEHSLTTLSGRFSPALAEWTLLKNFWNPQRSPNP